MLDPLRIPIAMVPVTLVFAPAPHRRSLPSCCAAWTGDHFGTTVRVIDTRSGAVTRAIVVGRASQGLTYFPAPGRIGLGHNGVYR